MLREAAILRKTAGKLLVRGAHFGDRETISVVDKTKSFDESVT